MVKMMMIMIIGLFTTSQLYAEGGNASAKVMVSKAKAEAEVAKTSQTVAQEAKKSNEQSQFVEQNLVETKQVEKFMDEELELVEKKTRGFVTGVSNFGFAVEFAIDKKIGGREIWFNFAEKMEMVRINETSEMEMGDMVAVVYDESVDKRKFVKRIEMLKKAPKEIEEEAVQEEKIIDTK